mgnify:CR=1 FL=1|tara:strand:+ start:3487 stop:3750 length:264 start_codon:yes stop_codon:yes gene_type:complete
MPKELHDFTPQESVAPYIKAVSVTAYTGVEDPCRAVYCGYSDDYELKVNGEWVEFKALPLGISKICATGAREGATTGPGTGDIIFLY